MRRRHQHADAVRADEPQAGGACSAIGRFGKRSRAVAEAGGDDDRRSGSLRAGGRDGFRNRGGRHRYHRDVDRPSDGVERFDGVDAFDRGIVRIDHVHRARKPGGADVRDHMAADRGFARARADDGERVRGEQSVQAIDGHGCSWSFIAESRRCFGRSDVRKERFSGAINSPSIACRIADLTRRRAAPVDLPQCRHARVMRVTGLRDLTMPSTLAAFTPKGRTLPHPASTSCCPTGS